VISQFDDNTHQHWTVRGVSFKYIDYRGCLTIDRKSGNLGYHAVHCTEYSITGVLYS
jgi:hypothetical protein